MAALLYVVSVVHCSASRRAFNRGNELARSHNWDAAIAHYEQALLEESDNVEYRIALQRALLEALHYHLRKARQHLVAEELEKAVEELELALRYGVGNPHAEAQLAELRRRLEKREKTGDVDLGPAAPEVRAISPLTAGQPVIDPSSAAPLNLAFAEGTSLRKVLETLAGLAGVNILFDESFRDKRVTVDLEGVSFEEALDLLTLTNGLFYKVVNSSTFAVTAREPRDP